MDQLNWSISSTTLHWKVAALIYLYPAQSVYTWIRLNFSHHGNSARIYGVTTTCPQWEVKLTSIQRLWSAPKLDCNGSNFNEGRRYQKLKWSTDYQSMKPFSMIPAATRTRTSRRWPSRWTTRSGASRLRPRVGPKRRSGRRSRGRSLTTFRLRASRFVKDLSHLKIRAKKQFIQQIYDVMMHENEHDVTQMTFCSD